VKGEKTNGNKRGEMRVHKREWNKIGLKGEQTKTIYMGYPNHEFHAMVQAIPGASGLSVSYIISEYKLRNIN